MNERDRPQETGQIEYKDALRIMDQLGKVVKKTGEDILEFREEIKDTGIFHGHETSSVDVFARARVIHHLDTLLGEIEGVRRFELNPYEIVYLQGHPNHKSNKRYFLIIDELDGTTNTKRALASKLNYRPQAAVSIAISLTEKLADLQVGALYEFHTDEVYSAMKVGENFLAYRGSQQIRPWEIEETRGDSAPRVLVVGYSNNKRAEKAQIEEALVKDCSFRVYDGCRASSVDIMNVINGQYDAYIDPRALWGSQGGAMLEAYDIGAVILIALGTGLKVSDIHNQWWGNYTGDDQIPLVVARTAIHQKIIETIQPLISKD
ncbi:hypothetical protein A3A60_00360 [Candidatus Curtissbacteria bacterium RIFCSPLOWO2_01_FULL_42_26]|uniref:Inositol monophosphatase n=1 Tax=Candidatus Curtissbacteria bacterium RIFCSPLOWO2_01_FULL_42_26 TaxID=1797729 RepID=A0A1F5HW46_9BACT|nr:MAG: hypothetical protein A3A60_00360 [Candidatus Curtissbacteria bacterium RIFCSPLOWO2_01_FULL_42_26]